MLPSSTVENYLKAIYQAQSGLTRGELVPMGRLAAALGVVPGTATTMVKTLAESGLVKYEPYAGVRLSAAGEKLAAMVLRRHRLIELFLVQVMGMSWTEVHDEAEHLEHAVSERLIERIDEMLGRPAVDPHGDPIPDPHGAVDRRQYDTLLTCPVGSPMTVSRVTDQDAAFLQFVERHDLKPGSVVAVEARDEVADAVRLRGRGDREITIGARAASKVLVQAVALLLALAAPATLSAQTASAQPARSSSAAARPCAVQGTVRDATGLPLPGVTITSAPASSITAVSDAAGRFCIADFPPDADVTLVATLAGFRPESRVVRRPAGKPAPRMDVMLQPAGFSDEIVVTATRTSRRLDDVPVRTEVVDKALMRAIGARTMADAVEYTTGVRVESNCQNCNFSQIRLLGLEGPYTQILVDGQPVISSLAQVYGIEQIPSRMIERIEIVKGGGSALYGSGSVGGVVNIISREPSRRSGVFETRLDLTDGLPNYSNSGSLDWASEDQRTNATAFFQLDDVKPIDVSGDGFTEVSLRQLRAGGGRASRYLLGGRAKLTGELTLFDETRRGGDQLRLPPEQANIAEWIDSRRIGASATWFHSVSPRFDYRLTLAAADMHRDSYYGTGQDPNAFGVTENLLVVADSQVNHYAGRHTVSWGGQATWEDLTDHQPAYDRFTDDRYTNVGIYAQDDWAFAKGWQLIYGFRADKHSTVDRAIVSPRLALMISPYEPLSIRASVARGFRAPQAFDEDLHLSSVGGEVRFIRLDPNLREERSTNYMLGAEWKPQAGPGQALFELNGFYTGLTDLFLVREHDDPATGAFEFLKVNHGDARVYGMEMNAGWGIGDTFVLQGGTVFQRARYGEAEPNFGSRDFFRTPHRYGNVTVTWTTPKFGTVFAGLRYTGSMKAPHYAGFIAEDRLETTPSFVTLDASVAYPLYTAGARRLTLTIAGRNLTNAFQRDLDQGILRDANYVYGPRFPRSIGIGLRVEL